MDDRELGVIPLQSEAQQRKKTFSSPKRPDRLWGIRCVPGDVSPGVKRPESGTDHSSQVNNALHLRFPTRRHVVLLQQKDNLTLLSISLKKFLWWKTFASSAKACISSHLQTNTIIIYARFRQQCRPGYGCQFLGQLVFCGGEPFSQPSHNPLQQFVVRSRHPDRIQRR